MVMISNRLIQKYSISVLLISIIFILTNHSVFALNSENDAENHDLIGMWKLTDNLRSDQLLILLTISETERGDISGVVDFPSLSLVNYRLDKINYKDGELTWEIESPKTIFKGHLDDYGNALICRIQLKKTIHTKLTRVQKDEFSKFIPRLDSTGRQQLTYEYKQPEELNDGWKTASLKDMYISETRINDMMKAILAKEYGYIHGVLIIKDGKLVLEEYFYEFEHDKKHLLASATKSVTSALFGVAIDQGHIKSVDQKLSDFFPEYVKLFKDKEKRKITLKHVLTMSAGLNWSAKYSQKIMMSKSDPIRYILEADMKNHPGDQFNYSTGLSLLLGEIIDRTTSQKADKFAEKYLFGPLGINYYDWYNFGSLIGTAGGLALRHRDMAKFGQLFLDGGVWNGKRIISEQWVNESTREHIITSNDNRYGYQWWQYYISIDETKYLPYSMVDTFTAFGAGGQMILVIPKLNTVVVFTGGNFLKQGQSDNLLEIVAKYIIPAMI